MRRHHRDDKGPFPNIELLVPSAYLHAWPCHFAAIAYIPTAGAKSQETGMCACMETFMRHTVWSLSKQFVDFIVSLLIAMPKLDVLPAAHANR